MPEPPSGIPGCTGASETTPSSCSKGKAVACLEVLPETTCGTLREGSALLGTGSSAEGLPGAGCTRGANDSTSVLVDKLCT